MHKVPYIASQVVGNNAFKLINEAKVVVGMYDITDLKPRTEPLKQF